MSAVPAIQNGGRTRANGPGYSVTAAAKTIPCPRPRLQRAVDNGEVPTITFGGQRYITATTINDIRKKFGIVAE